MATDQGLIVKRWRLAQRRKTVGLSQERLAEVLRVDVTTVRRWEIGRTEPQPWLRPPLAKALKVSVERLAGLLGDGDTQSSDHERGDHPSSIEPRQQPANIGLQVLIRGAGYSSLEGFAQDINVRARQMHLAQTTYDQISVQRWLDGAPSKHPDVVAAVLGDAWGIPIPPAAIWPDLRDGKPPIAGHLHPWTASRTLEQLGILVRTDMLTRRETLTDAIKAISGPALLTSIARWLDAEPGRLEARDQGTQRVGISDVEALERSTRYFAATDAEIGGALSREAAVGQLKYAVDLAQNATYSEATGNRLLAVIAELSGLAGWLCHDSGMPGPAQKYFIFGLQAARESADPRAALLTVSILADMAQQMRWLDRPEAALHLHDLAARQLAPNRYGYNVLRALLLMGRAEDSLCHLGTSALPEVRRSLNMAYELHAQATDEDHTAAALGVHRALDLSVAELHGRAALAYFVLAKDDCRLAAEVEERTLLRLSHLGEGQARNRLFSLIRLAAARFLAGEPEQACEDGDQAIEAAAHSASTMVNIRMRGLLADSEPYAATPRVIEFRDRLRATVMRLN